MKKKDFPMTLPKSNKKNLINKKKFVELADKVRKSFEEQDKYLRDKRTQNGHHNSTSIYF